MRSGQSPARRTGGLPPLRGFAPRPPSFDGWYTPGLQDVSHRPRTLVFVVAYEAESTLDKVLDRIPAAVFEEYDTEVLVIDDSSRDRTFEVGLRSSAGSRHPVTVLYNPQNQGYGGNQKLGYHYAIRHGFDYVVLLHGDGQYAPECIPDLLSPLREGRADAVFGSRMMTRGGARRGGMPLYKFVGNRILTTAQNRLLHSSLSEFHSGFRAYRVSTLAAVPFQYASNVFHFDTEIIIQLMLGRFRIVEVPIPTFYGDEISRVVGMRYAKDIMLATVWSRLHRLGILYDRRFDVPAAGEAHDALKLGYRSSHTMALEAVPEGARVLELGGGGAFAGELARKGCHVDGAPLEDGQEEPPAGLRTYDVVLLLDRLHTLAFPERFLDALRREMASVDRPPRLIVTTGNVAFWILRLQSLLGNFNYSKRGILDLRNRRLYTLASLRKLFTQCGFRIERLAGIPAPFPKALGPGRFPRALVRVNQWLIALSRGLFSYQLFLEATPLPTLDALLDHSITGSRSRAESVKQKAAAEVKA